jgi:uncharacterized integral membrane protein
MWRLLVFLVLVLAVGCRDDQPHPNQQAVDRAEKQADEAARKAELARQEARHQQRLREIDKLNFDAQSTEMQTAWSIWTMWLLALLVLLVIVLVWLAREIRFRRVLAHILYSLRHNQEGGDS